MHNKKLPSLWALALNSPLACLLGLRGAHWRGCTLGESCSLEQIIVAQRKLIDLIIIALNVCPGN
jgi:hypothetical protein